MQQTHAPTAIVIGAGLSGICMAIALKQQGIDFLVLEKSAEIGGTWSKNLYPGSGCDIPMFAYCYSFEVFRGGPWPKQPEILQYFKHCVDKYQIGSHLLLNTAVKDARFDTAAGRWQVHLVDGRLLSTRFLINATGQLDRPRWPAIAGLRDMEIPVVHTAAYPRDLDCHDKRIALLGNGASALQVVEALQPQAQQIFVFSRSAKYIYPRVRYAPATIKRIEEDGAFWHSVRDTFIDAQDRYRDLLDDFPDFDPFDDNSRFAEFYAQSEGVDLAAFQEFYQWLADAGWRPGYPTGCSRPLAADTFHQAIRADNVALLHDKVRSATARSLLGETTEYPVDLVICATGFALDNLVPPYRITGNNQQTLAEAWATEPTSYLGLATPGFPNLFFLYGPNTNTNASSVTFFVECQVNYIRQILALDQQQPLFRIEVKQPAVDRFQNLLRSRSVSEQAFCSSWYKNAHKRNISTFPGGYREYAQMARAFHKQDFDIVPLTQATQTTNAGTLDERAVQTFIRETVSAVTLIPLERVGLADRLCDYHMDSILIADFVQRINTHWGLAVEPATFFEFSQLSEFATYVATTIGKQRQSPVPELQAEATTMAAPAISAEQIQLWQKHNRKPALVPKATNSGQNTQSEQEPIAIIGTQAYLPDAADLDTFWHNLNGNHHAFREIPPERWSWRAYYGDPGEGDRTRVKWGAFLSQVDGFDPLFFKMSPREAELMDPQHRLFLMCAWELLEGAGYNPLALSGRNIGVMLGINLNDYAELVTENLPQVDVLQMSGLMHLFAANRLSYLLGFTGPSSVVDTACSSSLIAIHRAVQALHQDHCEMVIAGGANLILSPKMHLLYSKAGMLAEDGRCKTFSSQANGYARGEGVGAVLLKKLSAAERDGDMILGLIRGSAENHGGKANSLTSPNGRAQADLIVSAMTAAKVDPRTVGYIECHGTGTALGDPIEINGVKNAYERLYRHAGLPPATQAHCGLGSLKSNIGHLETAAGVASVIKVLLAMRHRTLPATLHATPRNPQIHLENSPFYVVEENRPWQAVTIEGQQFPLRAGVSSFGAGGSNAHLVLEAYHYPPATQPDVEAALIPLSARTPEQLQRIVTNLAASLARQMAPNGQPTLAPLSLRSVAFTLQLGREAMEQRLCLVVHSLQQLQEQLTLLARSEATSVPVFTGRVEGELDLPEGFLDASDWQQAVATMVGRGRLDKLAELWSKGYAIPWQQFHRGHMPQRVHLPTYPFALQRCWIDAGTLAGTNQVAGLHPLLHRNMSSFFEQCYRSHYRGDEFFLTDHKISGLNGNATSAHKVLPAVTYLEMACTAAKQAFASAKQAFDLADVVWTAPVVATRELDLSLQLQPDEAGDVAFEFLRDAEHGSSQPSLHCQGRIVPLEQQAAPKQVAVAELRARMHAAHLGGSQIYRIFADAGLQYGPAHQAIVDLYVGTDEALAVLVLPAKVATTFAHYHLHPSLLDGALQATIALEPRFADTLPTARLPFALTQLRVHAPCSQNMLAWVRRAETAAIDANSRSYDIDLLDSDGHLCVQLRGLITRALDSAEATPLQNCATVQAGMNLLSPVFVPVMPQPEDGNSTRVLVFCPQAAQDWVRASLPEAHIIEQHAEMSVQQLVERIGQADIDQVLWLARDIVASTNASALAHTMDAFRMLQALMLSGGDAAALRLTLVTRGVYSVHREAGSRPASAGVYGLAGSVRNELPDWQMQLLDIDQLAQVSAQTCLSLRMPHQAQALVHRAGEWFNYTLAQLKSLPESTPAMGRQRGVYVVVGGAGGVGELWSRYMIEYYDAQLVWIGRRPLDAQLDAKLQQLEQLGRRPLYIAADATDAQALHGAFIAIKAQYPRINGVVHSALLLNDRSVRHMDEQAFAEVFTAKAGISVNLERVFGREALDFMLLFSSLNSFSHGAGQANYAAGCTFTDAHAQYLDSRHPYPVKVVNWGFWGDVGVVADDFYRERLTRAGIGAMNSTEGFAALERLLSSSTQQWAVANFLNTDALTALCGPIECHHMAGAAQSPLQQPVVVAGLNKLQAGRLAQAQALLDTQTDSLAAEWVACVLQQANLLGQQRHASPAANTAASGTAHFHTQWLEHSQRYLAAQGWLDAAWQPAREIASVEQLRQRWHAHKQQTSAHPDRAARVQLLEVCLQHLADILRGERSATEVMFPNSSLELVEPVYNGNDIADGFNDILAGALVQLIASMRAVDPNREIRILEIGAGTGGTTKIVLPRLNALSSASTAAVVEYCYTDVSRAFLLHAEARFSAEFPALRTAILDVSKPLVEQGFGLGQYDFVLATNVLHATPNIRATLQNAKALLKCQGILLLNELSQWSWFYHLTFGLLEGWWLYQDAALRLPGSPGLLPETWREVLGSEGFDSIVMPCLEWRHLGQFITAAASDGVVQQHLQTPTPEQRRDDQAQQASAQPALAAQAADEQPTDDGEGDLHATALQYFQTLIADTLKLPRQKVHPRKSFAEYGLDSILIVQLTNKLKKTFSGLSTTLFFEVSTLQGLVAHLLAQRPAELAALVQPVISTPASVPHRTGAAIDLTQRKRFAARQHDAPATQENAIAIVGLSGRYPMAGDTGEFWSNLAEGRNCSSEIPPERWRWMDYFDAEGERPGTMYTKWGGFINDVDKFDPLFFRISPREALKMDPQERIFLEASYHAIEDAGYTPSSLSDNKQVGVFAGVMNSRYSAQPQYFSIANRVSYVMDFHGPSMAVDTACSSSLTAIHLAIDSLQNGSCEVAIAGGVNVIVDPVHFLTLTDLHMLSKGDSCKSFGAGADGFVDAEGVGAVVLKPLWKAERDGDHIHGVLLGSSINAGGKTHGYTVPNPVAQAELVNAALARAGVSPDHLSYLEAHGTGTALGDPIEIAGLATAFKGATRGNGFCAIGSLKSNIGHCESAAGIAGLTKVLLQLRHRMLAPSIHAQQVNPEIDFANTPFRLQTQLEPWQQPVMTENGVEQTLPRLAGVSSFGAGGANAHLIVREYLPPAVAREQHGEAVLVLLSARTAAQLQQKAEQLQQFLHTATAQESNLDDLAYTLQVGREALDKRLALLVSSTTELSEELATYLRGKDSAKSFIGTEHDIADEADSTLAGWLAERALKPLAAAWVRGVEIDWTQLQRIGQPRRISLPLYPFARERYWLSEDQRRVSLQDAGEQRLHQPQADMVAMKAAMDTAVFTAPTPKPNGIRLQATAPLPAMPTRSQAHPQLAPAQHASMVDQLHQPAPSPIAVGEIADFLRTSLAEALYMRIEDIEPERSYVDLGLDSIVAVEWIRAVNKRFGGKLSATVVYSYPTVREFARYLAADAATRSTQQVMMAARSAPMPASGAPVVASKTALPLSEAAITSSAITLPEIEQTLRETLAQSLYMQPSDIDIDKPFVDLGLDSIVAVEWIKMLNKRFDLKLNAARVYDYPDIRQLSTYLQTALKSMQVATPAAQPHPQHSVEQVERRALPPLQADKLPRLQPATASATTAPEEKIAIIGMSGRYPMAENLEQYWQNLLQGRDCVTEIPKSRWDAEALYDPQLSRPGSINSKWLGVLDDADCFDPLFFQIAPADAENMDPQHRLFLQESYRAFEDAGYANTRLSNTRCGVYMGIMSTEYYLLQGKSGTQAFDVTANSFAIGAARTAYHLNLKGPSLPVDTACSSSLVAVHLAVQALRNREIDMALAGGVSLYLAPETYLAMCQAGMLSSDGRCKAFDNAANGFVPAEGVGTLVLKRLGDAERDGDPIHAVIIGSGINQDGKTNGITAPSVISQIELEREVYSRYGIDPRTIGYVEAHGTGTKLGDPIELEALATVFAESTDRKRFCGIGSVKSNLGHTSGAAGVASVQKVVLAMQHQTLVPTLHVQEQNAHFDFSDSPFFITREKQAWQSEAGMKRRAAVSAFGYSGTNAHLVLEEYQPLPTSSEVALCSTVRSTAILLSARTTTQLQQRASDLLRYCEARGSALDIAALAFTLQVGREPMRERLGLLLDSPEELLTKLRVFIDGAVMGTGMYLSSTLHDKDAVAMFASDPDLRAAVDKWLQQRQFSRVLELWVKGLDLDWNKAYSADRPQRLHLPGYPFAKERYWIDSTLAQAPVSRMAKLHPLAHQNVSDFYQQKYRTYLHADDLLLHDHVIGGSPMLAGSMQIEMACSAVRDAWQLEHNAGLVVQDIRWLNAFVADSGNQRALHILLTPDVDERWVQFEIVSGADTPQAIVHSRGFVARSNTSLTAVMDLEAIQQRCSGNALDQHTIYQRFDSLGMTYGPSLRSVAMLYPGQQEVIARLIVPDAIRDFDDYAIHPCMLEGALHAVFGFRFWQEGAEMPVAIDELQLLSPVPASAWAWLKHSENGYEVRICDDVGRVCLIITGFSTCGIDSMQADTPSTLLFEPGWQELPASTTLSVIPTQHMLLMLGCETLAAELQNALAPAICLSEASGDAQSRVTRYGLRALTVLQAATGSAQAGATLIQVLYPANEAISLAEPLCALFETAHLENSGIYTQLVAVKPASSAADLQIQLTALRRQLLTPVSRCDDGRQWQRCVREFTVSDLAVDTALWQERGVYLITGGGGGLGLQVAAWVTRNTAAVTLILVGRSSLNDDQRQQMAAWRNRGATVEYHQLDISDADSTRTLVDAVVQRHGRINGILHSAGVLSDQRIVNKTVDEFAEVLAPKVAGALALDNATRHLELDCFVLFSSFAGYRGNVGQCDYAFANGFLDAFAHWRGAAGRSGRTLSINWPLWKTGGMQVESATLTQLETLTGMQPLPSDQGLPLLERLLATARHQVLVTYGAAPRIRAYFQQPAARVTAMPGASDTVGQQDTDSEARTLSTTLLLQELSDVVATQLKIRLDDLDVDTELSEYGFDSISFTEFANRVNQRFGLTVAPTVFFEYPTLERFADYLRAEFHQPLLAILGTGSGMATPAQASVTPVAPNGRVARPPLPLRVGTRFPATVNATPASAREAEPLAIVGVSARFPQAESLDAFWRNLSEGRDCIEEIPPERWNWRDWYGDPRTERNRTNIRYGAFITGIDEFDPLFFGISPREALQMDPQQRLLMTYAWKAIEDAGYAPSSLAGSKTGIFIGTANTGYSELLDQAKIEIEGFSPTGAVASVGPNRMSFLLDLRGPSEAIETACSSSLVAMHRAAQAIETGDCDMALVGGINTIITPRHHIAFSKAGMLAEDGRCKTFSNTANGYVRGEGVGMLLLKKLSAAERDGDAIYGLVRGTAENHGGRANSLTAPNPLAQTQLLVAAYRKAGIEPHTVGYIEAHGTGTALGDPVEINALKAAFHELQLGNEQPADETPAAHCGLGSVKSNIGHLELAAGVAGVIKVLLQFRHRQRVKTLHCDTLNPYIDLNDSPFHIQQQADEWQPINDAAGRPLPRRAGVSSFGFGGVNAHVVLEEYQPRDHALPATASDHPVAIVLSARTADSLAQMADELLSFVEQLPPLAEAGSRLASLAFTLQVGRDEMEERLAFIARDETELVNKLRAFLDQRWRDFGILCGRISRGAQDLAAFADDEDLDSAIDNWIAKGRLERLLGLWVQGLAINWQRLYRESQPARMHLPGYAFARERFWVEASDAQATTAASAQLHPLLHVNRSNLQQQCFDSHFDGHESFLNDHQVRLAHGARHKVLPAVAYLEMARAALQHSLPGIEAGTALALQQITWLRPCIVDQAQTVSVHVAELDDNSGAIELRIVNGSELLCRLQVNAQAAQHSPAIDLPALGKRLAQDILDGPAIYARLAQLGLDFGPTHRALRNLRGTAQELLAEIQLPEAARHHAYVLHPSLLDAALQASIGLLVAGGDDLDAAPLPFALDSLQLLAPLPTHLYAWVRRAPAHFDGEGALHLDIDLLDKSGRVCAALRGFTYRLTGAAQQTSSSPYGADEAAARSAVAIEQALDESHYANITRRLLSNEISLEQALDLEERA